MWGVLGVAAWGKPRYKEGAAKSVQRIRIPNSPKPFFSRGAAQQQRPQRRRGSSASTAAASAAAGPVFPEAPSPTSGRPLTLWVTPPSSGPSPLRTPFSGSVALRRPVLPPAPPTAATSPPLRCAVPQSAPLPSPPLHPPLLPHGCHSLPFSPHGADRASTGKLQARSDTAARQTMTQGRSRSSGMAAKRKRDADGGGREVEAERAYSSEEEELERELAEVPLGELQKARADGSHLPYGKKLREEKNLRRLNKNRPMEMSSKVPVRRLREVIQAPKKVFRDPRFESLCGNLDKDGFRKRYSFLFDEELPSEKKKLQQVVKKTKDPQTVKELKEHISWIDNQLKSGSGPSRNIDRKILSEHKKKEREAVKRGKQPFYLKTSAIRELKLVQKYKELKSSGKLESFMELKRKKNASKDARFLPYRRTNDDAA